MKIRAVVGPAVAALMVGVCASVAGADDRAQQSSPGQDAELYEEGTTGSANGGDREASTASAFEPVEIASILLVLNEAEVRHARLARERAHSDAVRSYAETVLRDHSSALERLKSGELARLGATRNDVTAAIFTRQAKLLRGDLESQAGESFDLTYMTSQLSTHGRLLGFIDDVFQPGPGESHGSSERADEQQHHSEQEEERAGGKPSDALQAELRRMRERATDHLQRSLQIHSEIRRGLGPEGTHSAP